MNVRTKKMQYIIYKLWIVIRDIKSYWKERKTEQEEDEKEYNGTKDAKNHDIVFVRGKNWRHFVVARYDPQIRREKLGIVYWVEGKKETKRHPSFPRGTLLRFA